MAVRRALYLARLRRRGVNGHVLPLLAFLWDGWGWEQMLPAVQTAVSKGGDIDRRALRRAGRVRSPEDLLLNVDAGAHEGVDLDYQSVVLPARGAIASAVWFGGASEGTSVVPFELALRRMLPGLPPPDPTEEGALRRLGETLETRRRVFGLATADVPAWLATLDAAHVARGRRILRAQLRGFRLVARRAGLGRASSPLNAFGTPRDQLAADLRRLTGRPTAAHMLSELIAAAMVEAALLADDEIRDLGV